MITIPLTTQFSAKALDAFNATGLPRVFKAQAIGNGFEIVMYDVIGTPECNGTVFADALATAGGAPLTIRLSSPGGSVFTGWELYNMLKNYSGESTVIVDGVCASIASVVALGADRVVTAETSLWMIHNAWTGIIGNAQELRASADTLDKIDGNLSEVYASKTGKDAAVWADLMSKETWFTASEALDAKLVDEIAAPLPKPKVKAKSRQKLPEAMAVPMAMFDPAEPVGLVNSAVVLLQEAIDALTTAPDGDNTIMDQTKISRQLQVRRALVAAILQTK